MGNKADIEAVNKCLETKANKASVATALHRKVGGRPCTATKHAIAHVACHTQMNKAKLPAALAPLLNRVSDLEARLAAAGVLFDTPSDVAEALTQTAARGVRSSTRGRAVRPGAGVGAGAGAGAGAGSRGPSAQAKPLRHGVLSSASTTSDSNSTSSGAAAQPPAASSLQRVTELLVGRLDAIEGMVQQQHVCHCRPPIFSRLPPSPHPRSDGQWQS